MLVIYAVYKFTYLQHLSIKEQGGGVKMAEE